MSLFPALPIAVGLILMSLLAWLRKPGKGGKVGRVIRHSDWLSWQNAVEERERQLEELKRAEPRI
jgi:hypothetical protein